MKGVFLMPPRNQKKKNNVGKFNDGGLKISWCMMNSEVIITTTKAVYNSLLINKIHIN